MIAADATVTASSTDPLFSARDAVGSGSAALPGAGWVSNQQTTGAWINLQWPEAEDLRQVTLVRNSLDEPGVIDGYLTFGDGSTVWVTLSTSSRQTVIPVSPRSVDSLRFTAAQVSENATRVTISEILVETAELSGDVRVDPAADGNVAASATVMTSDPTSDADAQALVDGGGDSTGDGVGSRWTEQAMPGSWAELTWDDPREVTSVQVVGASESGQTIVSGTLSFSDGSQVPLGAVLSDPSRPTTVSFMARVTTSVRLTIDDMGGSGALELAEIRVYQRGSTPERSGGPQPPSAELDNAQTPTCSPSEADPPAAGLIVRCPVMGSTIDRDVTFALSAAAEFDSVQATLWPSDPMAAGGTAVTVPLDRSGTGKVTFPIGDLPRGPFTVNFEATGEQGAATAVKFQLYRPDDQSGDQASSAAADGRTLTYSEEFDQPISISRSGANADYTAAKPVVEGVDDFGDAVFADPERYDNIRVVDDRYLRIDVAPLAAGEVDPRGWGRDHIGGMLASARPGGSGFSAQYGYFEIRMLAPAAPGTWPAFWMLPSDNLVSEQPVVAEIDAVELYGHEPTGACHSTHEYGGTKDTTGVTQCGQRFASERDALAWHTYGVAIMPDVNIFYIDGVQVASAPQVRGGESPMFFMVDLALGGGWPVDLAGVQNRASLFVDYIRVYV